MTLTLPSLNLPRPVNPPGSDLNVNPGFGNVAIADIRDKTPLERKISDVTDPILDPENDPPATPRNAYILRPTDKSPRADRALMMPPNTRPLSEEDPAQLANRIQELQKFNSSVLSLKERVEEHFKGFDELEATQKKILANAEYVDLNEDSDLFDSLFPAEGSSLSHTILHRIAKSYKWANTGLPIVLQLAKKYTTSPFQSEFKELVEEFKKLKSQTGEITSSFSTAAQDQINEELDSIQNMMDQINQMLKNQTKESGHKILRKTVKLGDKVSSLLVDKFSPPEFDDVLHRTFKSAFDIYKNSKDRSAYNSALEVLNEWSFHLQPMQVKIDGEEMEPDFSSDSDDYSFEKFKVERYTWYLSILLKCSNMDELKEKAEEIRAKETNVNLFESLEIDTCPLEKIKQKIRHELSQEKATLYNQSLTKEVNNFLNQLEGLNSIEEVNEILAKYSPTSREVPETIEQWNSQMKSDQFKTYLTELYYRSIGKRPLILPGDYLKTRKVQTDKRTATAALAIIPTHCKECELKDIDQIRAHFKKLHIDIDKVVLNEDLRNQLSSPQNDGTKIKIDTKDKWEICIADPDFCLALARQYVEYQETIAKLVHQATQQALRSKIEVEKKFLGDFRMTACNVSIAFDVLQLFTCWGQLKAAEAVLDLFVTNFSKLNVPGMGIAHLLYPLYPTLKFKLLAMIILLAEHFFAIKYKPYEYSLQGYKLVFQIHLLTLQAMAHYYLSYCQKMFLWLNIRLIENCIMGMEQSPFESDTRYADLNNSMNTAQNAYEKESLHFKEQLAKLKIKDANLIILKRNYLHQAEHMQTKGEEVNFLEIIAEALAAADVNYFPPEVIVEFKNNFGFDLTNDKNVLLKNLKNFFINNEEEFSERCLENRFSYLRTAAG